MIEEIILKEEKRQREGLELIASENFVSNNVLKAVGSILTNKYAEGYSGKRYYGGCEFVDQIENLAISNAKKLFGVEWVNVQPHSGSQANAAAMLGILQPGDKILGFDLSHGGHLTHGSAVSFSGKLYNPVFYGVEEDTHLINMEKVKEIALKEKPKLLIAGASAYSRDWDYKEFSAIAQEIGAYLMADIAHIAGFIATNLMNDPFKYCDFVTTTTHKTLRGPRGGMIMIGKDHENLKKLKNKKGDILKLSQILDSAVFPGIQGGPLMHVIAGKAVAFQEALRENYKKYMIQVLNNARAMSDEFKNLGYNIISQGTDNHLFLIDLSNKNITGKEAEKLLEEGGITVNKNMIPFDKKSPFISSGVRIGTPAITTRGFKEDDCIKVANYIDDILVKKMNSNSVKEKIKTWVSQFPLFNW